MNAPEPPSGEPASRSHEGGVSPPREGGQPGRGDVHGEQWELRESQILDMAYAIALDEVKESVKPFEQAKTRGAVLFGATSAAMAFLVGSALRDLDRQTFNDWLLIGGIVSFVSFSLFTVGMLLPTSRYLYLNGLDVRDRYFRGTQDDVQPAHAWDVNRVKWNLIAEANAIVESNVAGLHRLRAFFLGMLISAAASLAFWSVLVAYASPRS